MEGEREIGGREKGVTVKREGDDKVVRKRREW